MVLGHIPSRWCRTTEARAVLDECWVFPICTSRWMLNAAAFQQSIAFLYFGQTGLQFRTIFLSQAVNVFLSKFTVFNKNESGRKIMTDQKSGLRWRSDVAKKSEWTYLSQHTAKYKNNCRFLTVPPPLPMKIQEHHRNLLKLYTGAWKNIQIGLFTVSTFTSTESYWSWQSLGVGVGVTRSAFWRFIGQSNDLDLDAATRRSQANAL